MAGRYKLDGKLFNAEAIRDTNAHNSASVSDLGVIGAGLCAIENGLNQTVEVQFQGSFDDTAWHNIGSPVSVATTAKAAETFSDPWPYFRAVATCAVAPASGTLTVWYSWTEDR